MHRQEPDYYSVWSSTMNACSMTHDARDQAYNTWACPGGNHVKPGATEIDVWLQESAPRDKPLNFVLFGGISVVHLELLAIIGNENIRRDLHLGSVFGSRGKKLADWVTARGRQQLIIRGAKGASYRRCEECGSCSYFADGTGYLYPMPQTDCAIYESNHLGFVVNREIGERIRAKRWRRVVVEPLQVLDPPPDGLGVLAGQTVIPSTR